MPRDLEQPEVVVQELNPAHWLDEYGNHLYGYALRRLRNPARAEDMVQETLLAALETHHTYAGRSSEKTWLTGILRHKIIDFIRKQARELTVDDINGLSDATIDKDNDILFDARGRWIHPPRDWGKPDRVLENSEFIEAFNHCLGRLKPAQAQIFSLKEFVGQSIDAICRESGITATNCSVILYRARMALRRCLEIRWGDDTEKRR
jgi:RNA polymerase sigma-70 factor (ECF subfamily)